MPSMTQSRRYLAAAEVDGCLYAIGGIANGNNPTASVERLCPPDVQWIADAPMRFSRVHHAAAGKFFAETCGSDEKSALR